MNEELQQLIASLTTAENTDIIEQIVTSINAIPVSQETPAEQGDSENWQEKFNALQQKYVARFMNGSEEEEPPAEETPAEETDSEETTIEDLFK